MESSFAVSFHQKPRWKSIKRRTPDETFLVVVPIYFVCGSIYFGKTKNTRLATSLWGVLFVVSTLASAKPPFTEVHAGSLLWV